MDPAAPPAPTPPTAPAPAPRRRVRRWLLASGALFALLLAGIAALLGWAWYGEPALPWLLGRVPGLTVQGVRGTMSGGNFSIDQLDWTLPGAGGRLRIEQLRLEGIRWPSRYTLAVARASARSVQFDSAPSTGGAPPPVPDDLSLPLALQVAKLRVGTLRIDQLPPLTGLQATLDLADRTGTAHRVEQLALDWERARLQGRMQIGTGGRRPVEARLQAQSIAGPTWSAQAQASGPLERLNVEVALEGLAAGAAAASAPGSRAAPPPAAPRRGAAPSLRARAVITPLQRWPLAELTLSTRAFDLAALSAELPATALDGEARVDSRGLDQPVQVRLELTNAEPGRIDELRLPLRALALDLSGEPRRRDRLTLQQFELQLGDGGGPAGTVRGRGRWADEKLALELQLDGVQPARIDGRAAPLRISGPLTLEVSGLPAPGSGKAAAPALAAKGALAGQTLDGLGRPVRLAFALDGDTTRWRLREATAESGGARARFGAEAQRESAGWRIALDARLDRFDPLPWWRGSEGSPWRRGAHEWNGQVKLRGLWRGLPAAGEGLARWRAAAAGDVALTVEPSRLAGVPVAGRANAALADDGLRFDGSFELAGNRLAADGRFAARPAADRWQVKADAPALAALAPLMPLLGAALPAAAGWLPTAGQLHAEAQAEGRWPVLRSSGRLQLRGLRSPSATLAEADLRWRHGSDAQAPLELQLNARGLAQGAQQLDRVELQLGGTLAAHTLRVSAQSPLRPPAWSENLLGPTGTGTQFDGEARGGWRSDATGHHWRLQGLTLRGGSRDGGNGPWLVARELSGEASFDPAGRPRRVQLAPGRLQLLTTALRWRTAEWQAGSATTGSARLNLSAELETIDVAALLKRVQPGFGWSGDLTLGGRIEIRSSERFDADIVLERGGGDLGVTDELGQTQALGLSELRLAFSAHDGLWQFAQGLAGRQIGEMAGAQLLRTTPERSWPAPNAPLQGVLQMRVANLGVWSPWVPPGWRLGGSLVTSASIGGRFNAPELRGEMHGSGLAVRNLLQGVNVSDGELVITLEGERAEIRRFVFTGGDGRLSLTGGATLGDTPGARLKLTAEHFRVLGRIDRRLVASGEADLQLAPAKVQLDGRLRLDEGLIDLSRSDAPALDADVQVHRAPAAAASRPAGGASAPAPAPAPLRNAQIALTVDLGDKLQLRGRGIDTGVRGSLRVTSPAGRLALNGSVRTEGGTYAAYGQKLEISRGELVFTGAIDNPRLDVLAVRPNLDVVIGVSVTGLALNPRIRLVSEPEMSEYDKLSWLVLGRSPDGLGRTDTALLQRAAVALLAGEGSSPTDDLIKRLGLTDFSVRQTEGDVRETIVSLGRQLSRRWYVGYERGVNTTAGTWQLIYRVAQRFTLRAQSGSESSVDLIWSWRWN